MKPLQSLRMLGTGSEPPLAVKQRVRQRIGASLAIAAALGSRAGGAAASALAPTGRVLGLGLLASRTKVVAAAVGLWLAGTATGIVSYGVWRSGAASVSGSPGVAVSVPAAVSPGPGTPQSGSDVLMQAPVAAPPVATSVAAPSVAAERGRAGASAVVTPAKPSLALERQLLDGARAALGQGDGAAALAAVANHEQAFPQGALREERRALQVRALFALGRRDEAREQARAFVAEFPHSFLTPALESALVEP